MNKQVQVGVASYVVRDGKVLIGKRKGAHGEDTWAVPGGHQEFKETWEETASRETLEETGMQISNVRFFGATNDYFEKEDKHYVTICMISDWESVEPTILEPDRYIEQKWVTFDELKKHSLFLPVENMIKSDFSSKIKQYLESHS